MRKFQGLINELVCGIFSVFCALLKISGGKGIKPHMMFSCLQKRNKNSLEGVIALTLVFSALNALNAGEESGRHPVIPDSNTVQSSSGTQKQLHTQIVDSNLTQSDLEILDADKLGLEILGTISAKDPREGVALLKLSTGEAKAFKNTSRGNNIISTKDGIKYLLKEVYDDRMIIFREGKKFIVFKDKFLRGAKAPGQKVAVLGVSGPKIADMLKYSDKTPNGSGAFQRERNNDGGTSMKMDSVYKKYLLDNLPTILMQASAVPCQDGDGKPIGYQLLQVDEDSIFSKAGLKDGDCVTGINGNPLTDAASAVRLLQGLKTENKIEFDVNRSGSTSVYTLDIQ